MYMYPGTCSTCRYQVPVVYMSRPLWRKMAGDLQFSLQFSHSCTVFPESHSIAILSVLLRHYVRSFANPALISWFLLFLLLVLLLDQQHPVILWRCQSHGERNSFFEHEIIWVEIQQGYTRDRGGEMKASCMFFMCWYHWSSSLFTVS